MTKSVQLGLFFVLAASGAVAFACGGGSSESNPPNTGSASATQTSAPPASASAANSSTATGATAAASTAAPTPPAPPLVVAAMKLTLPPSTGSTKVATVELKDDGSLMGPDGKVKLKIVGAELQDMSGKTIVAVAADGSIKMDGLQKPMKFNEKDELVIDGGAKMAVGDDGLVKLLNPDGKADKDSGKIKFTGFKPAARRAATLVVFALLVPSGPPTVTPTSASAAPSAKPVTKKP